MSEIEAKRKEFLNAIIHYKARQMFDMSKSKGIELKGFDKGVEMARKEIFEKLNPILLKLKENIDFDYEELKIPKYQKEKYFRIIEELKKSLEEKK